MTLAAALTAELATLARRRETVGYGALARQLAIPGPGSIHKLTAALEMLMAQDAAAGRPFRAALCSAKLRDGLPAVGFFDLAQQLGRYCGENDGPEAQAFIARERDAVFAEHGV